MGVMTSPVAAWPPCCICDRPVTPWSEDYCAFHWPEVVEPDGYNDYWESTATARVAWTLFRLWSDGIERYMDQNIPSLPGEVTPYKGGKRGTGLFGAVKAAVPIEAVARQFTDLRPAGPNRLKGKCPLHKERTPSFVVYQDKRIWRCYGACARGGDVIELARILMDQGQLVS